MLGQRRVVVALAACAASFAVWVAGPLLTQHIFWTQIDGAAFRAAGSYTWHPNGHLYEEALGIGRLHYIYPPFGAVVFAPFSGLPFAVWKAVLIGLNLALLGYCADASLRLAGVQAPASRVTGVALLVAAGLWLEPFDATVGYGQSNLILLALVLADLAAPPSRRWRGVLLGIAAGIKLTPLLFVVYLLATRQRRPAIVAGVTFLATVVIGAVVLPHDAKSYWFGHVIQGRLDIARWSNQSLDGFAQRVTATGGGASPLWWLLVLVVGVPGFVAAVVAGRRGHRLLGACLCGVVSLLVSPMTWSHHWVWVIPALALAGLAAARARPSGWVGVGVIVLVFGWWPAGVGAVLGRSAPDGWWQPSGLLRMAPNGNDAELHWNLAETIYGNAYVIVGSVAVLAAAAALLRRRSPIPAPPTERVGSSHGHL